MDKKASISITLVGVLGVLLILAGTILHLIPKEIGLLAGLACWFIGSMIRYRATKKPEGDKPKRRRDKQDTAGDSE
jgi:hypothetical protein